MSDATSEIEVIYALRVCGCCSGGLSITLDNMKISSCFASSLNSACKLMAKQKVALECLSYHATASQDQTSSLVTAPIKPAVEYKLFSFKFVGEFPISLI